MDVMSKLEIIKKPPVEEILTETDLRELLESGRKLKHYIGFEISGRMHLGTGIGCMLKVVDLQRIGCDCSIFLADWHAWINNKLGGDWGNIQRAVKYYKEGFKACIKAVGGKPSKVHFIRGSDLYHNNDDYWKTMIDVSKNISIGRIMRSITILGRKEKELTSFAQLIYPPMQVADIFIQDINIAHAGIDQRKAHVIARDVALKLQFNKQENKPVALHHHLLLGLTKPLVWPIPAGMNKQDLWSSMKMSKSKPKTAIFLNDSPKIIREKVNNAFCPPKVIEFNPLIDWAKHLVFRNEKNKLVINRPSKFGGALTVWGFNELCDLYRKGKLHPLDFKNAMAEFLINFLKPVRDHFRNKQELIKMFDKFKVTR